MAEIEELREALRKGPTEEARKEAAEAFERYRQRQLEPKLKKRGRSKPEIVSLANQKLRKTYRHAIPLEEVAKELERSPEFFEQMRKVVGE